MKAKATKTKSGKPRVQLTLTPKEAKRLAALADFPDWSKQPEGVSFFLSDLHWLTVDAIGSATGEAPRIQAGDVFASEASF